MLVNYRVPPELLRPLVPPGAELDTPDQAPERHLLSLVALEFTDLRVRGVPIPTARAFAGVNLRFYVRRGPLRAATFLRQYAPAPLVVLGARLSYRQPYASAAIDHAVRVAGEVIHVHTRLARRGYRGEIRLRARNTPETPPPESEAHFLKERYWGFGRDRRGRGVRFRVEHPVWRIYPVEDCVVTIDPGVLLGGAWRELDWSAARHSVVFAEGSPAAIYPAEPLAEAVERRGESLPR